MECNECHERPASIHLTKFVNGNVQEIRVCEQCAHKLGYTQEQSESYSIQDLLSDLFYMNHSKLPFHHDSFIKKEEKSACPSCQLTIEQFQKKGKFGCASCYDFFRPKLDNILRRVHSGNTKHTGKIPKRQRKEIYTKKEISNLRLKLQDLIENEAFEDAAIVRDQIRKLESEKDGE